MKKKTLVNKIHKIYVILLFLFFYAPVAVMVVFSFNTKKTNSSSDKAHVFLTMYS